VARSGDAEAMRMIAAMPKWIPAKMNDKPIACSVVMPVQFTLK
jgi:hypothetical protein